MFHQECVFTSPHTNADVNQIVLDSADKAQCKKPLPCWMELMKLWPESDRTSMILELLQQKVLILNFPLQTADCMFVHLMSIHGVKTSDSRAFQSSGMYDLISCGIMPDWIVWVQEGACIGDWHIFEPYNGRNISKNEVSVNYTLSYCFFIVDQAICMSESRFKIFWSAFL